jgi:hypothetical protein
MTAVFGDDRFQEQSGSWILRAAGPSLTRFGSRPPTKYFVPTGFKPDTLLLLILGGGHETA